MEVLQLLDLSADALGHVLFRLPDAEDIARRAGVQGLQRGCEACATAARRRAAVPASAGRKQTIRALRALVVARCGGAVGRHDRRVQLPLARHRHAGTLYTWGGDGEGGEEEGTIGPIGVGERREPTLHPEEIVDPPAFRGLRFIVTAVNHSLCVDHDGTWSWGLSL